MPDWLSHMEPHWVWLSLGVLLAAAGLVMLVVALLRPAPVAAAASVTQAPAGLAAGATPTGGVHPGIDLAQLGVVMRNLSPATVIAVVAGVLYGMIRR